MSNTLVISDTHAPFQHKRALAHLEETYYNWGCGPVVCTGDFVDHHQISRHVSEPDGMSAKEEHRKAMKWLYKLYELFPDVDVVWGNHDIIPYRRAKEVGLSEEPFCSKIEKAYDFPKGWKGSNRIIRDGVLYLHNAGSGKYAALNYAREMSMSVVAGHTHRHPGVLYYSNPSRLYFGMNVGCLVDKKAYAMRYSDREVTLGCGVVVDRSEAHFVPLKLGRKS